MNAALVALAVGSGILACIAARMSLVARDRNTRTVLTAVALCIGSAGIVITVAAIRSTS